MKPYVRALTAVLLFSAVPACSSRPAQTEVPAKPTPAKPIAPAVDFGPPQGKPILAELTDAPKVPAATGRSAPAKVVVELEVKEVVMPIAEGVQYTFWTFGGKVPGKFIRVRQGDTVEFHLRNNASSKMPHNIDLHAVNGPGGGAGSSFTAPGHESVFTFKTLNQGLYVYHCATAPVGMHIANGMYGMILVEPPQGLEPVDHEYYVMQGDFYTAGKYHEGGLQAFDMDKAIDEKPTYVVFNGAEGALTGSNALKSRTGERVRLFVGNGGPNLVSSFHVIGEVFDRVYAEGGSVYQENVQTTLIPAGGASIVEFTTRVPGDFAMVDHAIFRAFHKGALGTIKVEGAPNPGVFSGKQADNLFTSNEVAPGAAGVNAVRDTLFMGEDPAARIAAAAPAGAAAAAAGAAAPKAATADEPDRYAAGRAVFKNTCALCHQADAKGLANALPPLAGSDFLMANKQRSIDIVVHGLTGAVTVNGSTYNSAMPPQTQLSDEDVANVLSFVRNNFGNHGDAVTAKEVAQVRMKVVTASATTSK